MTERTNILFVLLHGARSIVQLEAGFRGGYTGEHQRCDGRKTLADVAKPGGFRCEKWMKPVCRYDHIIAPVPEILDVRMVLLFAPGTSPLGNCDVVSFENLSVGVGWVFLFRDHARHVEIIAVGNVADGELLNEPCHRSSHTAIRHNRTSKLRYAAHSEEGCIGGQHGLNGPNCPRLCRFWLVFDRFRD